LRVIHDCRIQSMACNMVVHGYEEATEYEVLLDEGGFGIPLPHYFKSYVMEPLQRFDKMFFILQIPQHMRVKRVCQDITS
jgi:hypothetical protein